MLNCFSVTSYALIGRNCKEMVTICHVIYYYNFKNISNKKIEIQMLNYVVMCMLNKINLKSADLVIWIINKHCLEIPLTGYD